MSKCTRCGNDTLTSSKICSSCLNKWSDMRTTAYTTLMNKFLGCIYPFTERQLLPYINTNSYFFRQYINWTISISMLTPNIEIKPNYKPKGKIERTL
jgi:hypothetical protein